ncbi:Uncharacterized protein APZ42_011533 [Daphnia magna]|uniref:Uncharacterized protein n=1 Tax=Daphnia magna TaxID=35525 RepID=A0A162SRT6_9CRUS|nr:Uncharacterized protein APZ42_011533 [Daphnia magna]
MTSLTFRIVFHTRSFLQQLCKPGCMSHDHLTTWTRAQFELRVAQPKNNSAIFLPPLIFFPTPLFCLPPKRQPVFSIFHQSEPPPPR